MGTFSYGTETSPKPGGTADDWQATLAFPDPVHPSVQYVEFAKLATQTTVTVVAGTNAWSFLNGKTYSDAGAAPTGWGSTVATMDSNTFPGVFSFTLTMASNPGAVTFNGLASEVQSSSTSSFLSPKTNVDVPFTLSLTAQSGVPEPDTTVLLGLGAAFLLVGGVRRKTKYRAAG